MNARVYALPILIALCVVVVFGLYLPPTGHMEHEAGCLFVPGGAALCAAPLAHLKHWQSAFATILTEILVLLAALVLLGLRFTISKTDPQYERYRVRLRTPIRPPLFQELFAQGILNPKAP